MTYEERSGMDSDVAVRGERSSRAGLQRIPVGHVSSPSRGPTSRRPGSELGALTCGTSSPSRARGGHRNE